MTRGKIHSTADPLWVTGSEVTPGPIAIAGARPRYVAGQSGSPRPPQFPRSPTRSALPWLALSPGFDVRATHSSPPETSRCVVLVHGLYLGPWTLAVLARRLRTVGLHPYRFGYPSVGASPSEVADRLAVYLREVPGESVHLIAHSLGGLALHHLFHRHRQQWPGRVVTLGTPHLGSAVAAGLRQRGLGALLGRSVERGLLGDLPPWDEAHELGVIAGNLGLGLGRLFGGLFGPNDGTVAVAETRLPAARAHRVLPVSHTGLLVSARVAREAASFLASGDFLPQGPAS